MSEIRIEHASLGPLETNCYLVYDSAQKEGVLIDPGAPDPALERLITGYSIRAIVLTHAHWDHFGGVPRAQERTDAPLMLGEDDVPLYRDPSSNLAELLEPDVAFPEPDHLLADGTKIPFGTHQLTVSHAPGHSPGGIILVTGDIVFTGDTLFAGSVGRTDLPGGSWEALMATIHDEVLSLPDTTRVYPGHGPSTTIAQERASNPFLHGRG